MKPIKPSKHLRLILLLLALFCVHDSLHNARVVWSGPVNLSEVRSWYIKGKQLHEAGKKRQAIQAFNKAIDLAARDRRYHCTAVRMIYTVGRLWESLNNKSMARLSYRRAMDLSCRQFSMMRRIRRRLHRLRPRPPKPMVTKRMAPPPAAPVARAPRRPERLMRRRSRRPRRRMRPKRSKRPERRPRVRRHVMKMSARADAGTEFRRPTGGSPVSPKKSKPKDKKPKLQVWQRTKSNTILSKVSVGGGKYLKLEKLRVSVQVEGMRVRTVIDHIYHNPFSRQLQGTFKYTLPADASVSYYAMFVGTQRQMPRFFSGKAPGPQQLIAMQPKRVARTAPHKGWGKLREARLVPAEKARQVYEEITRRKIDPALLEQDAPNTFTGRVFPINPKGFNRVIIAYEQTLPQLQAHHVYRFRFPPNVAKMIDFSLHYNKTHATLAKSNLQAIRCRQKKQSAFLRCYWEQNKPKKDAVFYFKPKRSDAAWLAGTDPIDNQKYMLAQLKVQLPKGKQLSNASQAVFMLDTSLSAQPDLFAAHATLLQKILSKNSQIKKFNILLFDVGARWAKRGWMTNDKTNRNKLQKLLASVLLEGATDLSAAMKTLARPRWLKRRQRGVRTDVFVLSDGQISWGNRQVDQILYAFQRNNRWGPIRFFAYQMGIGAENLGLLRRLVRSGGALFPCLNRASLDRCATAHTKSSLWLQRVEIKGAGASQIMVSGRQSSVFNGAILTVAANYKRNGKAKIVLHGRYMGRKFQQTYPLVLKAEGDLGPRAWGEMALAQILELEDPALHKLAIAYAQHFIIPNKLCSFLVLETDKEYKQYGLDKWKQQSKVKDLAEFLEKTWQNKGKPVSNRERWRNLLLKVAKRYKFHRNSSARAALQLLNASPQSHFDLTTPGNQKIYRKSGVPGIYQTKRKRKNNDFSPFVNEAKRRLTGIGPRGDRAAEDLPGAIRALSCITERHPSNAQGLRLVGYYLRAWRKPGMAAQLFWRVLQRRSFEPHAFRDVAISMMQLRRYGIAAAMYEVILAGSWHSRFGRLKTLAREEYALLQAKALRDKLRPALASLIRSRKRLLGLRIPQSKLRVTVTWNTDNTDIDLWVIGPQKEKCYYGRKHTSDGGSLLQDITRGYGPERYQNILATPGSYKVKLHFYGHRTNVFGNETHASVLILIDAGTKRERLLLKNLVLKKRHSKVLVHQLKL